MSRKRRDEVDEPTPSGSPTTLPTVWTADAAHGLAIAEPLRTGTFDINIYTLETSCPFG
ncbi:MAG TPA: hypothetical protein VJ777_04905 [Mycobacterium sp.]|nr:hypothetical protein [Mycobacterium sp.]